MTAYFNDNDPKSAAWLRELMKAGLIADGTVDERSILDVEADDLREFTQCHFFAGIGGWSYALRLAGVPDDMEVWTGSPPCQPFSVAGKQDGKNDARHLAPKFASLVRAARPALLFGEQVASAAVFGPSAKGNRPGFEGTPPWAWLDDLSDRLEAARYAVWANDVPAAGVGGPHIRQRTFFGALRLDHTGGLGRVGRGPSIENRRASLAATERPSDAGPLEHAPGDGRLEWRAGADGRGAASGRGLGRLADRNDAGLEGRGQPGRERAAERAVGPGGVVGGLADTDGRDASAEREQRGGQQRQQPQDGGTGGLADRNGERGRGGELGREDAGDAGFAGQTVRLADGHGDGREPGRSLRPFRAEHDAEHGGAIGRLADAHDSERGPETTGGDDSRGQNTGRTQGAGDAQGRGGDGRPGPVNGFWQDADWLYCRDGKWRPVEAGSFPLAARIPNRVGLLRGYGNSIVPQAAQAFIEASLEALDDVQRLRLMSDLAGDVFA